jgi:hypothetical protein
MEAEYMALANACREALWLITIFSELGVPAPTPLPIQVDNHGTISFAQNYGFHARSKHIDIRHHFIRENIISNKISVSYVPTEDNLADVFTKALDRVKHERFTHLLGLSRN